jgi:hypothetical protein
MQSQAPGTAEKSDPQVWALATQSFVFLTESKGDKFLSFVQSKQNKNHKGVVEARIRKYVLPKIL